MQVLTVRCRVPSQVLTSGRLVVGVRCSGTKPSTEIVYTGTNRGVSVEFCGTKPSTDVGMLVPGTALPFPLQQYQLPIVSNFVAQ
eukprot:3060710-Rhodomonas_salina.1